MTRWHLEGLAGVASAVLLAACGTAVTGKPVADPEVVVTTTKKPTTTAVPTTTTTRTTATSRIGDLPADAACQVVSWDDLPPKVRHPGPQAAGRAP